MYGDDVDARSIVVWGLVCVFITVITFALLYALYNMSANERVGRKGLRAWKYKTAISALDQQKGALEQPLRWLDQQGETVGVPIDKAMELVLEDYQKDSSP